MAGQIKTLLKDETRCNQLIQEHDGVVCDFSRQNITVAEFEEMKKFAESAQLKEKIGKMFDGTKINNTEGRPVLHVATRAARDTEITVDGKNVVEDVYKVLDEIDAFANKVRSGELKGATGEKLTNIVVVGIGGSALGTEFVYEALRTSPEAAKAAEGLQLKILANVDPIDVRRALGTFEPKKTLAIVCSKTFTTAETMMNAAAVKQWLVEDLGEPALKNHLAATSTALDLTSAFGVPTENVFGFWDWVGGRFSVCSAVGMLPLTLMFGPEVMSQFRAGARSMDDHFSTAEWDKNLPVMMGLVAYHNVVKKGHSACAVLPYCQALHRFPAHIQQMCMESNGKQCTTSGETITVPTGEIFFGEPGTNGQHSFYQLMHQGLVIPADFIGFANSQNPLHSDKSTVTNHDELMCNFFAQPDALALGKTVEELKAEGCPADLIPHKTFSGDRPSTVILMPICDAYYVGHLLSLYEHRTAVQGFLWDLNSFDQWGVQLGKVLAGTVRSYLSGDDKEAKFCSSTQNLLARYRGFQSRNVQK